MPAYPNQTPDLGKINFDDIKESLKSYLKNQDTLRDFNFEGSVLQTLMNVLAYNTYYYAFYANMIANEMYLDSAQRVESIISLTKPLGYFVPLKSSAKATINMFGLVDDVPEYAHFFGMNSDGIVYSFYTIDSYQISDSDALNVEIYEAKNISVNLDVTNLFDGAMQRFFINDPDIDARTLKVKIQLDGQNSPNNTIDPWTLANTTGTNTLTNQNVYYLERTNNGVYVMFGKTNSLGKSVNANADKIFIDYLSSSGSVANDIFAFSFVSPVVITGNLNIGLVNKSSGGMDEPDLDLVKFAAPRYFGAQNRAVTKDDIKSLVAPFFESESDFNVFGGEETFPQMYGRVFFTADLDANIPGDLDKINQIYNILKSKCVVTVLPEFTTPKILPVRSSANFRMMSGSSSSEQQQTRNGIKTLLNNEFDSSGEYNYSFNASDAIVRIKSTYPNVIIEPSDFTFSYVDTIIQDGLISINLENELDIPLYTNFEITGEFEDRNANIIKLAVYITSSQNLFEFVNLKTLVKQGDVFVTSADINGRINIKKGIIEIYDTRAFGVPVTINVPFKNSYFTSVLNNKVIFRTSSVEIK